MIFYFLNSESETKGMYYQLNVLQFEFQFAAISKSVFQNHHTHDACRNIGVRKLQEGRIQKRALLVGKFLAIYFHVTYWL